VLNTPATPVVVVHGLWMNGLESFLLRNRLAEAGFSPSVFHYPSTQSQLPQIAEQLAIGLRAFGGGPVHLVGHSLGGLVILETLECHGPLPEGRAVLLGSPVRGSRAARAIADWPFGPQLLGRLAATELVRTQERSWSGPRELGVIAGSRSHGMGRIFADLPVPNDGTVCVDETRLPGATAQIVLEVSHTGMLISQPVADATGRFLATGSFESAESGPDV
jgi:pimeloyl-ACP methyl ester carboxylesterase